MRLAEGRIPTMEGTLRVQGNSRGSAVEVRADADGIISHAGVGLLVELADRLGLTGALGWRAGRGRRRRHPDAWVLRDLAVMLADGGDCLSDLGVLRAQPELFGEVASTPTAWRVVERLATDPDGLARLRAARAHARARAWQAGAHPDSQLLVVDLDATLVDAHSEKQGAAGTYKHTFGSIRCWPTWTAPMGPVSRWPACCDPATPPPTPPPTWSRSPSWRWRSCPPWPPISVWSCDPTRPARRLGWSPGCGSWGWDSRSACRSMLTSARRS